MLIVERGKSSKVNIEVVNTTSHDIRVKSKTTLGRLSLVQSVTPLEVRLRESIPDRGVNQKEARDDTSTHPDPPRNNSPTLPKNLQNIDLSGLTQEQKGKAI